ncbi:precorrin-6A synthase (deacetylating) [Aquabacter spiritensis]|uniref:Precorrin-6A synthase [deacetylating] n=1 Tax=Aquabacter spiritensis TaxID=933073 RepID=A0A4R3M4D6_9HYPH|nr:precorrin-6A synthase (deacetylating) [Aquabacter spiritensis]TCT07696.1 precorrin-6A synthase (deacetylating) [Aquabacter spiritensis]
MYRILIIGIGAGHPDHLTVQAVEALNRADVVFVPDKGAEKTALRQVRHDICARHVHRAGTRYVPYEIPRRAVLAEGYRAGVDDWHAQLAEGYEALFAAHLGAGEWGAFLVWGDPALYDSTLRIIERVRAKGSPVEIEVIPGISAVQSLAAQHRIALNGIGEPVLITTGRRLGADFPEADGSVVVMLDGEEAFAALDAPDCDIYWGAYLGTPDEILVSGPLGAVKDEILSLRRAARARHGWIMDTYLLRRPAQD